MDFETAKAKKKPNEETVPIALDPVWAAKVTTAQGNLGAAEIAAKTAKHLYESLPESAGVDDLEAQQREVDDADDKVDECKKIVDALMSEADDKIVKFRLRALSANEIDDLAKEYPPTPEQREDARKNKAPVPPYNYERYHPAYVHASLLEPQWTLEQIVEIWNDPDWNVAELRALYGCAQALATTRPVIDLGEG